MKKQTLILVGAIFMLQSCLMGRFTWYNFSDITDHKIFPTCELGQSTVPFYFTNAVQSEYVGTARVNRIDSMVAANNSVAFLVIRNDSILYDRYYQNYDAGSTVASFSMAKFYTSALIGAAIAERAIKSIDEPIINYLPVSPRIER